jgi:DNA-binding LacI/PurR family transcriptional regulator
MSAKTIKISPKRSGRRSEWTGDAAVSNGTELEGLTTKVQSLAEWLQQDIRRRGLRPGDRYLTSQEAARLLEVSTGTAHEAMRVLVEKNVLDRRRKRGTYVGPAVEPPEIGRRSRVYVLSPSEGTRDPVYTSFSEAFYPAIAQALDGAALQLEFMPAADEMSFVRTLAHEAESSGDLAGFLLMRPSYEVQEFFQEHRGRLPAVVLGSVYPGITGLPWVDGDQGQIARLAVECVLRRGHRRIAVLRNDHWAPGDNAFMSGLIETIETSRQHVDRLEICGLPPYERPIRHRVRELLSLDERPTAIIVHTAFQGSLLLDVVKELGLRIPDEVDVIKGGLAVGSSFAASIPHADSVLSMREIGDIIGRMLASLRQGQQPDPSHLMFPVRFNELEK